LNSAHSQKEISSHNRILTIDREAFSNEGGRRFETRLPLGDAKAETEKASAEQLLLQEQRSLLPGVHCGSVNLIVEIRRESVLLERSLLFSYCSRREVAADDDNDEDSDAMHLLARSGVRFALMPRLHAPTAQSGDIHAR